MSDSNRGAGNQALAEQGKPTQNSDRGVRRNQKASDRDSGQVSVPVEQSASLNEGINRQQHSEAQQDNPYAARDIIAQEIMADASVAMAVAAFLTLVVSGVGVALVWRTLVHTRRAAVYAGVAARQAKKANDAALAAVKVTSDAAAVQLRPYVSFTARESEDGIPFSRNTLVKFQIKNFGQSPANNVTIHVGGESLKGPIGKRIIPLNIASGNYGLLSPGDHRNDSIHMENLDIASVGEILSKEVTIYLRARVEYTWPTGSDSHDLTIMLADPERTGWVLIDDNHRNQR